MYHGKFVDLSRTRSRFVVKDVVVGANVLCRLQFCFSSPLTTIATQIFFKSEYTVDSADSFVRTVIGLSHAEIIITGSLDGISFKLLLLHFVDMTEPWLTTFKASRFHCVQNIWKKHVKVFSST